METDDLGNDVRTWLLLGVAAFLVIFSVVMLILVHRSVAEARWSLPLPSAPQPMVQEHILPTWETFNSTPFKTQVEVSATVRAEPHPVAMEAERINKTIPIPTPVRFVQRRAKPETMSVRTVPSVDFAPGEKKSDEWIVPLVPESEAVPFVD